MVSENHEHTGLGARGGKLDSREAIGVLEPSPPELVIDRNEISEIFHLA
jgi:hypothetical protein